MNKFFFLFLFFLQPVFSCTDFVIKAKDGTLANGRSMEFGAHLQSEIVVFPKGLKQQSVLANQVKGKSWETKYAFMGMNAFGLDFIIDGMNEKGLSIGGLWFPETEYPSVKNAKKEDKIALMDLGNWILGSFASVKEAKEALLNIEIVPEKITQLNEVPPLHFALHDASGDSMVVEFIKGKMHLYENPVGVLTNSPSFDWHITNLRNYINLSAINVGSVDLDGSVLSPTGQGSGLLGIPGDWTPPSRFVRISVFKNFITPGENASQNVNLAFHLLNTVDIPYGAIRDKKEKNYDYTQWVVVKDLTNRKMYWRTYQNLNIKEIDFSKSRGGKILKLPL